MNRAIASIRNLGPGELPDPEAFTELCSFEHRPTGLQVSVDRVERIRNYEMVLEGRVVDGAQQQVGTIERWCHRDGEAGQYLAVKPASLRLDPTMQGKGFGRAAHRALIERCRDAGVHRLEILTQDVGSYAWALEDYELHTYYPYPEPPVLAGHDQINTLQLDRAAEIRRLSRVRELSEESTGTPLIEKVRALVEQVPASLIVELQQRVLGDEGNQAWLRPYDSPSDFTKHVAEITEGKMTKPCELALFGRDDAWIDQATGRETWLGRELLLLEGTEWRGVMMLQGPA